MLHSSPQSEPDLRSTGVLAGLVARDLDARVAASECCGEQDLRICVRRHQPGPAVELLCRNADVPEPPQWHAVRLIGDERTVWRGPVCDAEFDAVVAFVEDLLSLDEVALSKRYQLLS